ncbi:hypothetical protein M8J76_015147 [Diaphorina citri]|nr:hypothetical protein M8J76_015147 [Diaphorina citri]
MPSWALVLCIGSLVPLIVCADALEKHKLIIIGAGPSGIAAATKLVTNGIEDFIILEAEDRLGGRVHNIPYGGDYRIDMGAQWVHGQKGNVVYEMAKPFDLVDDSCKDYTFTSLNSTGAPISDEVSYALFDAIEEIFIDGDFVNYNGSLGDFIRDELKEEFAKNATLKHLLASPAFEQIMNYVGKNQNTYDGSENWFETSARGLDSFTDLEGCFGVVWKKGGYGNKQMPGQTPIDLSKKLLLKKEVTKINWEDPKGVVVTCADGTQYSADRILITVSLGVLKSNLITFVPPLPPKKLTAIEGLYIGTIDKLFLKFPSKWWPDSIQGYNFLWTNEDQKNLFKEIGQVDGKPWVVGLTGFFASTEDPLTLLGWITGPTARFMEGLSLDQIQADTMKLIRHFVGPNVTVPEPTRCLHSSWGTNPHFRGSYSCRSLTTERLNTSAADLGAPVSNGQGKPVLLFAGEATSEHQYSTVNGAVETGWREADRILTLKD